MVWLLGVICAGLLGWLIFMWLNYQSRASALRLRQEQARQRTELHLQVAATAREKTGALKEGLVELEENVLGLKEKLVLYRGSRGNAGEEGEGRSPTRHRVE